MYLCQVNEFDQNKNGNNTIMLILRVLRCDVNNSDTGMK